MQDIREQLNKCNQQLKECNIQLKERNTQLAAAHTQLQEHADHVKTLQKELDDVQEFVFRLQPKRSTISPEDAAGRFRTLCGSVEDWVQTNLCDVLDRRVLLYTKDFTAKDVRKFMTLVSAEGRKSAIIEDTDEQTIIAAIIRFLYDRVFALKFWFPLFGAASLLNALEEDMSRLEPRRGRRCRVCYFQFTTIT